MQAKIIQKLPVKTNSAVKASLVTELQPDADGKADAAESVASATTDGDAMDTTNVAIAAQAPEAPGSTDKNPLSTLIRSKVRSKEQTTVCMYLQWAFTVRRGLYG